jgi:hypothetical protein
MNDNMYKSYCVFIFRTNFYKKNKYVLFVKRKPLKKQFIIPNSIVVMKNEKEVDL